MTALLLTKVGPETLVNSRIHPVNPVKLYLETPVKSYPKSASPDNPVKSRLKSARLDNPVKLRSRGYKSHPEKYRQVLRRQII